MTQDTTTPADESLAFRNGKLCAETGRPMNQSNPYSHNTRNRSEFERGYRSVTNER